MIDLVVLPETASSPLEEVSTEPVRFHLSLNVSNLSDAVAFYRVLFDQAPAKHHRDYAKFDVQQPPVVFSLTPRAPVPGGSLSHLGLRVPDRALLDVYRSRLEAAGICTSNQDATVCGYAKQDKLWLRDPDGNFWEIYHIEEDVAPESVRQSLSGPAARIESPKSPTTWEHYITTPLPASIPLADQSLDEVLLTGTFNADASEDSLQSIVREACRVLKPGGRLSTHGLMGNAAIAGDIALPGMAGLVQRIPNYLDVMQRLRAAGFVNVEITKFTDKAWFELNGVGLREVKVDAYRPPTSQPVAERTVLYRGPFARLVADGGRTFVRGQRTAVDAEVWNLLRQGTSAESFVFFEAGMSGSCSASSKG